MSADPTTSVWIPSVSTFSEILHYRVSLLFLFNLFFSLDLSSVYKYDQVFLIKTNTPSIPHPIIAFIPIPLHSQSPKTSCS